MRKVAFHTLGCKVNIYDTEAMIELFEKKGYNIVDFDQRADIYVINTCTVTNLGDRKSRQMIRKAKKQNKNSIIVVTGCYAQVSPDEIEKIPEVDLIIGTKDRHKIVELLEEFDTNRVRINVVGNIMKEKDFEELNIEEIKGKTRAFLKIQEGCNQFCSYCIIPYARGPIRSRKKESVIKEVNKLVKSGYKEIVLTGIHIASYGKDLLNVTLMDVIKDLDNIIGLERIRLSSIEPNMLTDKFLKELSYIKIFCPHFHISLQSGSNSVLDRMKRKYTTVEFEEIVKKIRLYFPEAAITTDIIVGFPGETEMEFEETFKFANQIRFSKIHVFKYSPRKGTPAAEYSNQITGDIKEVRSKRLLKLSDQLEKNYYNTFISKEKKVLFEKQVNNKINLYEGHTDNYILVRVYSNIDLHGKIINVKLNRVKDGYMEGEIIK